MIAPVVIDRIRRLLAERKLSERKIAALVGVSRGTVAGVARGDRPDYEAMRRKRQEQKDPLPRGPLGRCPTCGGKVYMPCRLCQMRAALADWPPSPRDERPVPTLDLELRGETLSRYEAIHRLRMQQGELIEQDANGLCDESDEWPDDCDEER
ncbi:MAG: helix-turn-helix transcriptional regulator [Pirellulaceae bacterium]|nr:helix-turn-helix transcriptional regulator [Pirellulaceae bacterium]